MTMPSETRSAGVGAAVAVVVGACVAVGLGVFGKVHDPQFFSINVAGFSSGVAVKTWLATLAVILALFQFGSAFAMYGLLRGRAPRWISTAHVWSGRLAVLASVPEMLSRCAPKPVSASNDSIAAGKAAACAFGTRPSGLRRRTRACQPVCRTCSRAA